MVAKLSKTFLIGVIVLLSLIIMAGVFYIVRENSGAKARYSVTAFTPQGDVPQWVDFSWTFSEPIVDNTGIGMEVPQHAIRFTPAVEGKGRWVARDSIRFTLDGPLAPSAGYTVELSPSLSPSTSFVLSGQRRFSFATRRFEVTNTSLEFRYDADRQQAKAVGTIDFNYPVNIADLKAHLSMMLDGVDGGREIPYHVLTETSTARTVRLETSEVERGHEDRVIHLRIQKGFKCTGGQLGLEIASVTPIVLSGSGTLGVTYCNVEEDAGIPYIALHFSTPVPSHTVAPYLQISVSRNANGEEKIADDVSLRNPSSTLSRTTFQVVGQGGDIEIYGDFKRRATYTLTIREGLKASDDSVLKKPYTARLTIPDVPPTVRFLGSHGGAGFLAREGALNLGVATINVNRLHLEIEKVFANNLIYLAKVEGWSGRGSRYLGTPVHEEIFGVEARLNEEVTTSISLGDYLTAAPGIFKVVVRDADDRGVSANQWVVITDLGLLVKRIGDSCYVWVKSLETHKPVPAARVKLISSTNQTLLTGTTNWRGFVKFTEVTQRLEGPETPFVPFMLTVAKNDDMAFVQLDRHEIATADFNVAGPDYLEKGYEAFLWTSRGVYRPGETVELAGIVRGARHVTPRPLPVHLEVLAPDGRILREARLQTSDSGAFDVRIEIPAYAQTGGYIAILRIAEKGVGRARFQVEEFMPDRMKVTVTTDKPAYTLGEAVAVEVTAVNLYGPPAAERHVEAHCELTAVPLTFADWKGFTFGTPLKQALHPVLGTQRIALGKAKTDGAGKVSYPWKVPEIQQQAARLRGVLTATVREVGGRAVTASHAVDIHPHSHYVGLRFSVSRNAFGEGGLSNNMPLRNPTSTTSMSTFHQSEPNTPMDIEFIAVDATGASVEGRALTFSVIRMANDEVVRNNGVLLRNPTSTLSMSTLSEAETTVVERRALTSGAEIMRVTLTPPDAGDYRVSVEDSVTGARTELEFSVGGWGTIPVSMTHSTQLDMSLDKPTYRPGQTAKLRIQAPFPGTLLLTVEREKLLSHRTVTLTGNTATLNVPVFQHYAPNVYLSATLISSVNRNAFGEGGLSNNMPLRNPTSTTSMSTFRPGRAFGVIPLKLNAERNRLSIEMEVPGEVRPNREVEIAFRVRGARYQQFDVCMAAVDEDILALTDFQTPRPHDYFYRQRGLATRTFDVYGVLLPELFSVSRDAFGEKISGDVVSLRNSKKKQDIQDMQDGQDKEKNGKSRNRQRRFRVTGKDVKARTHLSERNAIDRETRWAGIVRTDARGRGTVRFRLPQFNGTLRLMAVAFAGARYGSAEASLRVREPIVLTPTFPRFLAGGDKIRVPVTLSNGTGADGTFTVQLTANGAVELLGGDGARVEHQVTVASGDEGHVSFEVRAHDAIDTVVFNLSASGNAETTQQEVTLPLRSATPPITQIGQGVVRAGAPVDFVFPSNLFAESSEFSLTLSPFPAVKFAESLRYLIGYPYGCVEQTTSRVFPLLYFSELAAVVEPTLAQEGSIDDFIRAGITRLESMLHASHHFAYWPNGTYVNPWSSLYAAHFLVEARKAGYAVAERVYADMLIGVRELAKLSVSRNAFGGGGLSNNMPLRNPKPTLSMSTRTDGEPGVEELSLAAYACYVLAAAGQPEKGAMHYLKDQGLSGLSDYSQFQLTGAFALSGGLDTALSMLPVSVSAPTAKRETGGTLNSPVRAQAIMLDMLAEVNENHPALPMLVQNLMDAVSTENRWGTTQENAFAFLALGKIMQKQKSRDITGTLTINGEHFAELDTTEKRYTDDAWDGAKFSLTVEGEGACYYYWTAFGIPRDSFIEEYSRELQVRRRYFDKDGEELTHTYQHGELVVAEITVKALTESLENVVVVDMVPAGFKIENPRLESRTDIPWIKSDEFKPDYVDIRDDRLIFFGNFPRQRERKFYYALRAVTQGEFILPPVAAEAMYDATKSAVAGSRRIEILRYSHGVR